MPLAVGVEIRRTRDIVWCDAGALSVPMGSPVIIETDFGVEMGAVKAPEQMIEPPPAPTQQGEFQASQKLGQVLRLATADDSRILSENRTLARTCFQTAMVKIRDSELSLKLVDTEYTFDRQRLFIYYTAEERVDFRELIKELSHALKVRVQMLQVGARDAAKRLGGIGPCGKITCCCHFLAGFKSISMEMARDQGLSPNPTKLTGMCGKLKCCLAYECHVYQELRRKLPFPGDIVETREGRGKVREQVVIEESVLVEMEGGLAVKIKASDITARHSQPRPPQPDKKPDNRGQHDKRGNRPPKGRP